MEDRKQRKKSWEDKVKLTQNCYYRCKDHALFSEKFYQNLFFLNPKIKDYFIKTDWKHQSKALMHALDHLFHYFDEDKNSQYHKDQLTRIAISHSKKGMNVHPHNYYYWMEALVMTLAELDESHYWNDDLKYYIRETLFFPISFITSFYHIDQSDLEY